MRITRWTEKLSLAFVLASFLILSACHPTVSSKTAVKPSTPNTPQADVQCSPGVECKNIDSTDNTPNKDNCAKATTVTPHLEGVWKHVRTYTKTGRVVETSMTIDVQNLRMKVQNTCTLENVTLVTENGSAIHLAPAEMDIQSNGNSGHQETVLPSGKILKCDAAVYAGSYHYSLTKGDCLILTGKKPNSPPYILTPN